MSWLLAGGVEFGAVEFGGQFAGVEQGNGEESEHGDDDGVNGRDRHHAAVDSPGEALVSARHALHARFPSAAAVAMAKPCETLGGGDDTLGGLRRKG